MTETTQSKPPLSLLLCAPRGFCAGVDRAIQILETDMRRTMALLGVSRISDLTPDHVRLLGK